MIYIRAILYIIIESESTASELTVTVFSLLGTGSKIRGERSTLEAEIGSGPCSELITDKSGLFYKIIDLLNFFV